MIIGLLGCGHWGQLILKTLRELAVPVLVVEPDPHARQLARDAGARLVDSVAELAPAAGLIVATPATTHYALLRTLNALGKPIFVEKPFTTSVAEAETLAEELTVPVFLMHIWRYHAGIRLLGDLNRSGELGDCLLLKTTRTNWTSPRTDTDSVWTLAPHDLTIAREILGFIPPPRAAVAERHGAAIRSMTAVLGDNPAFVLDVSTRYADKRREVRLHGTKGVAVLADERTNAVDIWFGDDRTPPDARRHERRHFSVVSPLHTELRAFLTYLQGGAPPVSDLAEGVMVVRYLHELIQLSQ